jgi:hypothetical protein
MGKYQKINTLYRRDEKNVIMPNEPFTEAEFEYLRSVKWRAEEKIDGTNMRLEVTKELIPEGVNFKTRIIGKTDDAKTPSVLMNYLMTNYTEDKILGSLGLKTFVPIEEWESRKWGTLDPETKVFTPSGDSIPDIYTIYGEGFCKGIGAAKHYSDEPGFYVFDVQVGSMWLKTDVRDSIAEKLGAPLVPYYGELTIDEAIEIVRNGFQSAIAKDKNYIAEGLVLRTPLGLLNRLGKRLIVKIKHADFTKYEAVQAQKTKTA